MATITVDKVEGEINYEESMKEFGIEKIDKYLKQMKGLDTLYRRGIVFGHRDFGLILDAIKNKKPFAVLTGFNPSGPLHLGNLMILKEALFLQKLGADVYIPISNDETYVFKKSDSLEKATKNAYEYVIPTIIALGFDPKKTKIFISTQTPKLYELAVKVSAKTTFSSVKAIFGFNNDTNPGQIFYAIMQSAHILFPQTEEFGGPKPTIVNIGIDQDPYMRLVRDIAEKLNFVKPSSTYHTFMPGLLGGKMSGSKPETCIFLTEDPKVAEQKIMRAFSGGGQTLEEHRKKGGNPDIDVACQYLYYMFEEDDKKIKKIFDDFRSGKMTSGEVKKYLAVKVKTFLIDHQRKREKAKTQLNKFLIK
ncbi:MAG: tryptophan--tRNA ligase [Candidatus Aenigmarchaeota archaeon]|nr:tryptophan--tRNA ligase [Candidatus Aenigmarchaeota archaeon]